MRRQTLKEFPDATGAAILEEMRGQVSDWWESDAAAAVRAAAARSAAAGAGRTRPGRSRPALRRSPTSTRAAR